MSSYDSIGGSISRDLAWFAIGFGTALVIIASVVLPLLRSDIYNVDHWKLNVCFPPKSMWMNMGYWRTTENALIYQFDEACQRLLEEVLSTAGLMPAARTRGPKTDVAILDLGIGCGDQTKSIVRLFANAGRNLRYVGLTNIEAQVNIAKKSIKHGEIGSKSLPASVEIFLADAAQPRAWSSEILSTLEAQKTNETERWVLGLDSFYHFKPSRMPIFRYAFAELDASVMAFDLILSDTATLTQRLAVQAIGVGTQCPWHTFVPLAEYRAQLQEAGFDPRRIETRDVTMEVFPGLIDFMDRQAESLSAYGISMTRYRVFQRALKFFLGSGALRAVIVVAKRR